MVENYLDFARRLDLEIPIKSFESPQLEVQGFVRGKLQEMDRLVLLRRVFSNDLDGRPNFDLKIYAGRLVFSRSYHDRTSIIEIWGSVSIGQDPGTIQFAQSSFLGDPDELAVPDASAAESR